MLIMTQKCCFPFYGVVSIIHWKRYTHTFSSAVLSFSDQYDFFFQAHEICVKRGLLKEQVFILGRMGNAKQALTVIINKLGDIEEVRTLILVCLKRVLKQF